MKITDALSLNGEKVTVKKKNRYTPEIAGTVTDKEVTEVNGKKFVDIKLDNGSWYGYKEVKKYERTRSYGRKARHKIATCRYADEVTDLLARRIRQMPEYKNCEVVCYPPMGLDAKCSIAVKDKEKIIGFLTIMDRKNGFVYDDYNAPKKTTYPKDSIGDLNGFNIPKKELPTKVDEAIKLVFSMYKIQ